MKKLIFSVMMSVFAFQSFSQTTEEQWVSMMQSSQKAVDDILERTKPTDIDLQSYKLQLFNGDAQLPDEVMQELEKKMSPLVKYGTEAAQTKGLPYEDESDLIFYCVLSPGSSVDRDIWVPRATLAGREAPFDLTWSEVLHCAGVAIGVEAVTAISQSGGSAWSFSTIKKVFKTVAKRMMGPIGVGIATLTFGVCLISEAAD